MSGPGVHHSYLMISNPGTGRMGVIGITESADRWGENCGTAEQACLKAAIKSAGNWRLQINPSKIIQKIAIMDCYFWLHVQREEPVGNVQLRMSTDASTLTENKEMLRAVANL